MAGNKAAQYCPECKKIRKAYQLRQYKKQGRITNKQDNGTGYLRGRPYTDYKKEHKLIRRELHRLLHEQPIQVNNTTYTTPDITGAIMGYTYQLSDIEPIIEQAEEV
jgi:hypothetical protein